MHLGGEVLENSVSLINYWVDELQQQSYFGNDLLFVEEMHKSYSLEISCDAFSCRFHGLFNTFHRLLISLVRVQMDLPASSVRLILTIVNCKATGATLVIMEACA